IDHFCAVRNAPYIDRIVGIIGAAYVTWTPRFVCIRQVPVALVVPVVIRAPPFMLRGFTQQVASARTDRRPGERLISAPMKQSPNCRPGSRAGKRGLPRCFTTAEGWGQKRTH